MPYLFNSDGVCEKCEHDCLTQSSQDHVCKDGVCQVCIKDED
jgi:hypothetical protein